MNESIRRELDRQMRAQGMGDDEIARVHAADPHALAAARKRLGGRMRAKGARPEPQVPPPTMANRRKVAVEKAKLAAMRSECARKSKPWESVRWNDMGSAEPYDPERDPFVFTCVIKAPPASVSAACVVAGEERTQRRCVRENPEPPGSKWTLEEDGFLLGHTDVEAALWTGRSINAARRRRAKLERRA